MTVGTVGTIGPKGLVRTSYRPHTSSLARTSYRDFLPTLFRQGIRADPSVACPGRERQEAQFSTRTTSPISGDSV